jgi:hypothetical protein
LRREFVPIDNLRAAIGSDGFGALLKWIEPAETTAMDYS